MNRRDMRDTITNFKPLLYDVDHSERLKFMQAVKLLLKKEEKLNKEG